MKKTRFLVALLGALICCPAMASYTLDDAVGYAYYNAETSSWVSDNVNWDAAHSILSTADGSNFGNGYHVTVALTLDTSKLSVPDSGQSIFKLGQYWGLGINANGQMTGTWQNNLSYYVSGVSAQSGYTTVLITMTPLGTTIRGKDSTWVTTPDSSGLKGSSACSSHQMTIDQQAASALRGIAVWRDSSENKLEAAEAYNSMAQVTNPGQVLGSLYQEAYQSSRADGTSLGRVTFLGDSITHGIADQTWRLQLFKTLVDNGVEFEISGCRTDYNTSYPLVHPEEISYGGTEFVKEHLAQSSGRTYNLIHGSGTEDSVPANVTGKAPSVQSYGGYNISDAAALNSDTYIMLIGTNDLLSDTPSNAGETVYAAVMKNLLGGEVTYADGQYTWTSGTGTGNMGTLVDTLKTAEANKTVYLMSVPTWGTQNGTHGNHDATRTAVQQYNKLLGQWVDAYNANNSGANVRLVDINDGLVDVTTGKFQGVNSFFRGSGDGIHPNVQGSLIIASNLAAGMGLAGRTAGQVRMGIADFDHKIVSVAVGRDAVSYADCFTGSAGYTISLDLQFGNGATDGWSATDVLSLTSGNGSVSGTLNITEGYIKWGNDILFSRDMSQNSETLRLAYITGDTLSSNLAAGYYVWLDDKLIGQGLAATEGSLNGLTMTSTQETTVNNLAYTNGSYAPTTDKLYSKKNAYLAVTLDDLTPYKAESEGSVNFWGATVITQESGAIYAVSTTSESASTILATTSSPAGDSGEFFGAMGGSGVSHEGSISLEVKASGNAIFGVVNAGKQKGDVTVVLNSEDAEIGSYTSGGPSIIGGYNATIEGTFTAVVEGGTTDGDIVGGFSSAQSDNYIGSEDLVNNKKAAVKLFVNNGTIGGNIYGGSTTSAGDIRGGTQVTITGGLVKGSVYGGGTAGNIDGETQVLITGGVVAGSVYGGGTDSTMGEGTSVTVQGNKALIKGNIEANHVTLRDVAEGERSDGFDRYANTIAAKKLTLKNVTVSSFSASLRELTELEVTGGTQTALTLGEDNSLNSVVLAAETTISLYKPGAPAEALTENEVTLHLTSLVVEGCGSTLNANLEMGAGSTLTLAGTLMMGSSVSFHDGVTLAGSCVDELYRTGSMTLMTGVDKMLVNDAELAEGASYDAGALFAGLDQQYDYKMTYANGEIALQVVPEPVTTTLSLLALVALAARRRRSLHAI